MGGFVGDHVAEKVFGEEEKGEGDNEVAKKKD